MREKLSVKTEFGGRGFGRKVELGVISITVKVNGQSLGAYLKFLRFERREE